METVRPDHQKKNIAIFFYEENYLLDIFVKTKL